MPCTMSLSDKDTYFEQSNKNMAVRVFYNSLWSKKNAVL